jgi:ribosomal protein S27E
MNHEFELSYDNLKIKKYLFCPVCGDRKCTYKYNIGDKIHTKYGDLLVLDRYYTLRNDVVYQKRYKYKCLSDAYIGEINEQKLSLGRSCPVCSNQKVVKGINDIATTHSELVKYFANIDDTYIHTHGTKKLIKTKCPECNNIQNREKTIYDLVRYGFSCEYCSDGISYPEKVMYNLLEQLKIEFVYQLSKKNLKWCNGKLYDFYLPSKECIIEVHGSQHYKENAFNYPNRARTFKEEQQNDKFKELLAIQNGIKHYIIIDCSKSALDFIKDNIINSQLNELISFSDVDWMKVHEFAIKGIVKDVCNDYNIFQNTSMLIDKYKVSLSAILKYLKQGTELSWCNYNSKEAMKNNGARAGKNKRKKVICLNTNEVFESASLVEKQYGISHSRISACCRNKCEYAGFHPMTGEQLKWQYYNEK